MEEDKDKNQKISTTTIAVISIVALLIIAIVIFIIKWRRRGGTGGITIRHNLLTDYN